MPVSDDEDEDGTNAAAAAAPSVPGKEGTNESTDALENIVVGGLGGGIVSEGSAEVEGEKGEAFGSDTTRDDEEGFEDVEGEKVVGVVAVAATAEEVPAGDDVMGLDAVGGGGGWGGLTATEA